MSPPPPPTTEPTPPEPDESDSDDSWKPSSTLRIPPHSDWNLLKANVRLTATAYPRAGRFTNSTAGAHHQILCAQRTWWISQGNNVTIPIAANPLPVDYWKHLFRGMISDPSVPVGQVLFGAADEARMMSYSRARADRL